MPDGENAWQDGGIELHVSWSAVDGSSGRGWGTANGTKDRPSLLERARSEWIRLQPGEFLVFSRSLRGYLKKLDPGTVEYWVEYTPPSLTLLELAELKNARFVAPTEKIETEHENFDVY